MSRSVPQRPPSCHRWSGLPLLVMSCVALSALIACDRGPVRSDPKAAAAAASAGAARSRAQERARAALDDLQGAIERAARPARHVHSGAGIREALLKAEIRLGEGRTDLARGEPAAAADAAADGAAQVAAAVAAINRFLNEYRAGPRSALWARWVRETQRDSRADRRPAILVDKLRRQMLLIEGDEEIASYDVDLGLQGVAAKVRSGDDATPEGRYRILEVRGPGRTRFHRALLIDYPNDADRARFRRLRRAGRVARGDDPGGLIEIHGQGGRRRDWTEGCIALSDSDIDDLAARVEQGTPVTIVGTIPDGARR